MAVYFFEITDGATQHYSYSTCSPSAAHALHDGRAAAWLLMCGLSQRVQNWSDWRINVSDEAGRSMVVLPFAFLLSGFRYSPIMSRRVEA